MLARIIFIIAFLVTLSCAQHPVIQLSVPKEGEVYDREAYAYFTLLSIPGLHDNSLIFVLTPLAGDADLYISTTTSRPSVSNHDWKSTEVGGDIIEIKKDHPKYSPTGPYYIGVHGFKSKAYFTLLAFLSDQHVVISETIPQLMHTKRDFYTYFRYYLDHRHDISITVTATTGDPDIYVSTITDKPTRTNYTWNHIEFGSDVLKIRTTDPNFVHPANYYIGTRGFIDTTYTMLISHNTTSGILPEGTPITEDVELRTWVHFKFRVLEKKDLRFTLTRKSSGGDPDLYIKYGSQPSLSDYDWSSNEYGSDSILISKDDPKFKVGWYYIGVYGYAACRFELVAITEHSHILLRPGLQQEGAIEGQGKYVYYRFAFTANDPAATSLDIVATAKSGRLKLFASTTNRYPSAQDKEKEGEQVGASSLIKFDSPSYGKTYYVSVYSLSQGTNYTITASTGEQAVVLRNGVAQYHQLDEDAYKAFQFDVEGSDVNLDVIFAVQHSSGLTNMYIGAGFIPNTTHYTWKPTEGRSTQALSIHADDPARKKMGQDQKFFVTLHGIAGSSFFAIIAHTAGSIVELYNGNPVAGRIEQGKYSFYKYYMPHTGRLSINLNVGAGDDADLYASRDIERPTKEAYTWRSIRFGSDFLNIDATKGYYYISVYGYYNSSYRISASNDFEHVTPNGVNIVDHVKKGQWKYYTTYLNEDTDKGQYFFAGLTLISGNTELYVNDHEITPNMTNYKYKDSSWPGNTILVKRDENFKYGRWTLGVYGKVESEYLLRISLQPHQGALRLGLPQIGKITATPQYFTTYGYWMTPEENYILSIKDITQSKPGVFSCYVAQEFFPNQTKHTWKAENIKDHLSLMLEKKFIKENAPLYIMLVSTEDKRVGITLGSESSPYYLTQEQAYEQKIQAGVATKYQIYSSRESKRVFIQVESCSNQAPPKFFVSKLSNVTGDPSTLTNPFTQTYNQTHVKKEEQMFYIETEKPDMNRVISIYGTTLSDRRPIPGNNGVISAGRVEKIQAGAFHFTLTVPTATDEEESDNFVYYIYMKEALPGETLENVNMIAPCSIVNIAKLATEAEPPKVHPLPPNFGVQLSAKEHEQATRYFVNVIVANKDTGVRSAYQPIIVHIPRGWFGISGVSIGGVFILIITVLIATYIIIGMIVKKFYYGSKGLDLIPNRKFWSDLPYLVRDGFMFCIKCGKRDSTYIHFEDHTSQTGAVQIGENPFEKPPRESINGGYGTI